MISLKYIFNAINFSSIFNNKVYIILIAFSLGLFTLYCVANIPSDSQQSAEYTFENSASYIEYTKLILSEYANKKVVALTFDDGPGKYTDDLLEILEKYNAKATFFILGSCVQGNEAIIQKAYEQGHEIATHGYSHKIMTNLSTSDLEEDIQLSLDAIYPNIQGDITLLRPPYGLVNDNVENILSKFNLKCVKWDLDSLDWKLRNTGKITQRVLSQVEDKKIILMHDIYKTSVEAVECILQELQGEYEFISVTELMILKGNE